MAAMTHLERYLNGEHEAVWSELQALGLAVRVEPHDSLARAVAAETMRRVRRNCERLVERLRGLGYEFGTYPDGSRGYYTQGALVASSHESRLDQANLEDHFGPLPISLVAFWEEVGSVDFIGRHPTWPRELDPLVVYPPEAAIADLDAWEVDDEGEFRRPERFEAGLAPDVLHKDNVSGGNPYSVALPNSSADFPLLYERHDLLFVPYLRLAILRWGGFPGLDGRDVALPALADLKDGLESF